MRHGRVIGALAVGAAIAITFAMPWITLALLRVPQ